MSDSFQVKARSQKLVTDARGLRDWKVVERSVPLRISETALLLCDVWNDHGCLSALERMKTLLPRMQETVQAARNKGILIVNAPSETMPFYKDHPARLRVLQAPKAPDPVTRPHDDPPLPVDDKDGGCDGEGESAKNVWKSQHPAITIDPDRDLISDQGRELHNVYVQRGIKNVMICGVHTNMCVLHRTFSIKQMVRWGYNVFLVRDLTDALYNPIRPPYVSYPEGFRLIVGFIEKFWCPTLESRDLI